jgi:hypothetical protein
MRKAVFILLLSIACGPVIAQSTYGLTGEVMDSSGALRGATVRIITAAGDTLGTSTGIDGSFSFKDLSVRTFNLYVSMEGHTPFGSKFELQDNELPKRLQIKLKVRYHQLDPVIVSRLRPMSFQIDTTTYFAGAFPVRDGSDVEAILKRLPGIEVDMDGNIIVQGKKVRKVLVNGKEFFGGDVLLAIRNLPADVVEKLQIIDDYGDKARLTGVKSGESAKVLNIALKSDKSNGAFGRVEAGAGNEGKYAANAFANAFHGERQVSAVGSVSDNSATGRNPAHNVGLNYADQWDPRWGGSFNFIQNGQIARTSGSSIQDNYYASEKLHQEQADQSNARTNANVLKSLVTYKLDNYSSLRLNLTADKHGSSNQSVSTFSTSDQDSSFTRSTTGQSLIKDESAGHSLSSNLYYEKFFPQSVRRLSATASVDILDNKSTTDKQTTALVSTDGSSDNTYLRSFVNNKTYNWSANFSTTYFLPLSPSSFLELGYTGASVHSQISAQTQTANLPNAALMNVDSLDQNQLFNSFTHNLHAGYSIHLKKIDLSAGIDGQQGAQHGSIDEKGGFVSYHYFSLVRNLQASWVFNPSRRINLSYNGNPVLPGLTQLAPYTNLANPQYPVTGNPALRPAFTHTASLHFEQSGLTPTSFQGFGAGLNYVATQNSIITSVTHPRDSSQVIEKTGYLNAGTTQSLSADYHVSLPSFFKKRLTITANGSLNSSQTPTMSDGILYMNRTWAWNQALHLQLYVPDVIEADVQGNYSISRSTFPAAAALPTAFKAADFSASVRQYFFKDWQLYYRLAETYISSGKGLQPAPANLTASIQRQFLRHNKATISLTGYNLLNGGAGVGQTVTPTGVTQTRTDYTGRYFLCSFLLKLSKFNK